MNQKIQEELLAIKGRAALLKPEDVLSWAKKNPTSAIHSELEWDDNEASHQYRLWQVRKLISIHVVTEEGERRMLSLSIDQAKPGGGYRTVEDIVSSKKLKDVMLADALRELERVRSKYGRLKALAGVWGEVDRASAKQAKHGKTEPRAAKRSRRSEARLSQ